MNLHMQKGNQLHFLNRMCVRQTHVYTILLFYSALEVPCIPL